MYTTILMAALTVGSSTPAFGHHRGCYSSCSCSGCYGGSCYGSWGGGWGCHGCYGGWGGAGYGWGYGGGYSGCYGCYGGGYGYGNYGGFQGVLVCNGCYGCYGGYSCYGIPNPAAQQVAPPAVQVPMAPPMPAPPAPAPTKSSAAPSAPPMIINPTPAAPTEAKVRTKVIIELPEDARLFVDGHAMRTKSSRRIFQTPELSVHSTYYYDLRIELERNGKLHVENQRIVVRPGSDVVASFRDPNAPAGVVTVQAEE
jgi:uncharacterized protein (TIGR03000 family)